MDVEQHLRKALHEGARDLDVRGRGPAAARGRARQLIRRRRAVPAALVATTVGAGAVAWAVRADPSTTVVAAPGLGGPENTEPVRYEWRSAPGTVAQPANIVIGGNGKYYALSTAPGVHSDASNNGVVPQALYRSDDGLTWDSSSLGPAPWVSDLDERDGVLYALGTGPGTAGGVTARAASSSDDGANWNDVNLPLTAQTPAGASVPLSVGWVQPRLAVGKDVMVASIRTTYSFNSDALMSPAERDAGMMTGITDAGVQISSFPDADECRRTASTAPPVPMRVKPCEPVEQRMIPWSDLGLNGMEDLNVDELFVSTDGQDWKPTASPFVGYDMVQLSATPFGIFGAAAHWNVAGTPSSILMRSTDGETWAPVGTDLGSLERVGVVGSRLVAIEQGDGVRMSTSDDGGTTWTTTDLAPLVAETMPAGAAYSMFAAGPLGVAVVVVAKTEGPPRQALLTSADGTNFTVTPLTDIIGADAPNAWVDWIAVGPNGIAFTAVFPSDGQGQQESKTYLGTPVR